MKDGEEDINIINEENIPNQFIPGYDKYGDLNLSTKYPYLLFRQVRRVKIDEK